MHLMITKAKYKGKEKRYEKVILTELTKEYEEIFKNLKIQKPIGGVM